MPGENFNVRCSVCGTEIAVTSVDYLHLETFPGFHVTVGCKNCQRLQVVDPDSIPNAAAGKLLKRKLQSQAAFIAP